MTKSEFSDLQLAGSRSERASGFNRLMHDQRERISPQFFFGLAARVVAPKRRYQFSMT
jgi:hypothetical protein